MKRDELPAEMVQVTRPTLPAEGPTVDVTAQIVVPAEAVLQSSNPSPTPVPNDDLKVENERLQTTVEELSGLLEAQADLIQEVAPEPTTPERTNNAAEIKPVTEEETPVTPAQPVASDAKPPEPPANVKGQQRKSVLRNLLFG